MKKLLVAFDGLKYDHTVVDYALHIAQEDETLVVGIFLHDLSYLALAYTYRWGNPLTNWADVAYKTDIKDDEKIKLNAAIFADRCERAGVAYKIHVDTGVPIDDLLTETAYADLLLMDERLAFQRIAGDELSAQLIELLNEAHCPILVTPSHFEPIENVIVTYDGTAGTTYAMKMYSYLFKEWRNKPVKLVSVNKKDHHLVEKQYISEWMEIHFDHYSTEVITGDERKALIQYLKVAANRSMVVMGAYHRSPISMMFRKSLANAVISQVSVPVLIAHP